MLASALALGGGSIRPHIERMGNAEYLTTSYYEHWLAAIEARVIGQGGFTADELAAKQAELASGGVTVPERRDPEAGAFARSLFGPFEVEVHEGAPPARFGVGDRVRMTGWVSEEEKADLMAGCCGALYLAFDEDSYGYVTLEAFHSYKPVVTLTDSGGSLEVIEDGHNGFVREPEPEALGEAMTRLWRDRAAAREMGENAYHTLRRHQIDWDHVIGNLTA